MLHYLIVIIGVGASLSFTISASYPNSENDPFIKYRDFAATPFSPSPRALSHYGVVDKLIISKLKQKLSKKERSILQALHWLIGFADNDDNFDFISANFFILLHEMTASRERLHQKEVAALILQISLARAEKRLAEIYPKDENGKNKFLGLMQILLSYPQFAAAYQQFYQRQFRGITEDFNFQKALKNNSYQEMYEHLINASFIFYYLANAKNPIAPLPKNSFLADLKMLEQFEYKTDYPVKSYEFVQLSYLATHVLLVLTNYGQFALRDSINARKAAKYLEATFDKVRDQLGYLDLFAEYIQGLKIANAVPRTKIEQLEDFLLKLQRPDGSWGTEQTFKSDPYTAFHPTWAVITALNQ